MSGVLKIKVRESSSELKELLRRQKNQVAKERIQVLYWIKTKQAESVNHLAVLIGRHRTTVSRWRLSISLSWISQPKSFNANSVYINFPTSTLQTAYPQSNDVFLTTDDQVKLQINSALHEQEHQIRCHQFALFLKKYQILNLPALSS